MISPPGRCRPAGVAIRDVSSILTCGCVDDLVAGDHLADPGQISSSKGLDGILDLVLDQAPPISSTRLRRLASCASTADGMGIVTMGILGCSPMEQVTSEAAGNVALGQLVQPGLVKIWNRSHQLRSRSPR